MVALVIGLFMMCWAPAHFIHLWMTLDVNFPYSNTAYYLKMGFHTISYFNRLEGKVELHPNLMRR